MEVFRKWFESEEQFLTAYATYTGRRAFAERVAECAGELTATVLDSKAQVADLRPRCKPMLPAKRHRADVGQVGTSAMRSRTLSWVRCTSAAVLTSYLPQAVRSLALRSAESPLCPPGRLALVM